jgi:uncharacterized protein YbjT (DUF2867 family)
MDVVVAGGHGKIALRLLRLLSDRGDRGRGLIRNPDHAADLEAAGGEPVLCDLEQEDDVARCVEGADAGSGAARKQTMDLGGAVKLIDAARANGIARYVMVSAIGAGSPERFSGAMRPYIEAKAEADRRLAASGLDYTIVRPGGLTDEQGGGRIRAGLEIGSGQVARDDVAATLLAVLGADNTIGKTFDLLEGDTPIEEAVRAL